MRLSVIAAVGFLALASSVLPTARLGAQMVSPRLPTWGAELTPLEAVREGSALASSVRRHHATTGLIIGSAVGAVATTVFLMGFCGDADTACGADEFGRAIVVIALPCTAVGALVGWLIRTDAR